ncbi:MAG: hypothetical protein HY246_08715 [Proteobacteria bacterium]|nr:hypothetical protein [Pseudomonadota bacterium]
MAARGFVPGVVFLAAIALAGCAYRGGVENPIIRKATWFSYLGGDDIRRQCVPGEPARYRLVYNAMWEQQVRTYDLRRVGPGNGAVLSTLVFGGGGSVASFSPTDPTAPWRGQTAERRLPEADYLALIQAIDASGFGAPSPEGLVLPSWGFYWAVAACADGRFHFNAWLHPSDRFAAIRFADLLFTDDGSGVAVNEPRPLNEALYRIPPAGSYDPNSAFELRVGENGLSGTLALF